MQYQTFRSPRTLRVRAIVIGFISVVTLAGCVSNITIPAPGPSHPASAAAEEAPLPAESNTLKVDASSLPKKAKPQAGHEHHQH